MAKSGLTARAIPEERHAAARHQLRRRLPLGRDGKRTDGKLLFAAQMQGLA
jgi:hypothetical protein